MPRLSLFHFSPVPAFITFPPHLNLPVHNLTNRYITLK